MAFPKEEPQVISDTFSPSPNGKSSNAGKITVIVGATNNPNRYAYIAAGRLLNHGHPIIPVGIKRGKVMGKDILDIRKKPILEDVDTVTMYINPTHQSEWEDYILSMKPRRIIFNPGTENPRFASRANDQGIETLNACTLVMLGVGNY